MSESTEPESKINPEKTENNEDEEDAPEPTPEEVAEIERKRKEQEKAEEAKLKSRYPSLQNAGSSQLLQKRLSKGTKYFDSGDYNMAKAKTGGSGGKMIPGSKPPLLLETGEAIPTPESVPHKKVGPQQSKLAGAS